MNGSRRSVDQGRKVQVDFALTVLGLNSAGTLNYIARSYSLPSTFPSFVYKA